MTVDARRYHGVWVDPRAWRVKTAFGSGAATGSVVRIGPHRIEAMFAPSPALPAVGRTGTLVLANDEERREAQRQAVVAHRIDVAADLIMFEFDLQPGPADHGDLPVGERRAVRVPIPEERPMRAAIRCSAGEARGKVLDLSRTGVSLVCPAAAERQLATASRVEVRFADNTALGDSAIVGRIQNRRFDGDKSVTYGIEFAPGAHTHLDAVINQLERTHVRLR
ncbi:MAG: PilZ domain-containing protein [Acidimicrobiales bacterium]